MTDKPVDIPADKTTELIDKTIDKPVDKSDNKQLDDSETKKLKEFMKEYAELLGKYRNEVKMENLIASVTVINLTMGLIQTVKKDAANGCNHTQGKNSTLKYIRTEWDGGTYKYSYFECTKCKEPFTWKGLAGE